MILSIAETDILALCAEKLALARAGQPGALRGHLERHFTELLTDCFEQAPEPPPFEDKLALTLAERGPREHFARRMVNRDEDLPLRAEPCPVTGQECRCPTGTECQPREAA